VGDALGFPLIITGEQFTPLCSRDQTMSGSHLCTLQMKGG
jgi:hypothetical protein